jgi:hypothetical protein
MNDAFSGSLLSSFYHKTTPTAKLRAQNLVEELGSLQPLTSEREIKLKHGGSNSFSGTANAAP